MPTAFISYRREGDRHQNAVLRLATALRDAGIEVTLDAFAQAEVFHGGGPDAGWPQWCEQQATTHRRVLVAASDGWFAAWSGTHPPGAGLGCAHEARTLQTRL